MTDSSGESVFFRRLFLYPLIFALTVCVSSLSRAETVSLWDMEDLQDATPERLEIIKFYRKPIVSSYWEHMPGIRICTDSNVTEARADRARKFWIRLGYEIGEVYIDDGSAICRIGGVTGEITVMLVNTEVPIGNKMAVTRTWFNSEDRSILRAQVYVLGGFANKERLLEHEIGHALGWAHYNRRYHLMNALYPKGGHDTMGLTYREYKADVTRLIESNSR